MVTEATSPRPGINWLNLIFLVGTFLAALITTPWYLVKVGLGWPEALTEAQKEEAILKYQKTIQTAFREVSDALIGYRKTVVDDHNGAIPEIERLRSVAIQLGATHVRVGSAIFGAR